MRPGKTRLSVVETEFVARSSAKADWEPSARRIDGRVSVTFNCSLFAARLASQRLCSSTRASARKGTSETSAHIDYRSFGIHHAYLIARNEPVAPQRTRSERDSRIDLAVPRLFSSRRIWSSTRMLLASAPVELLSRVINESISSSLYTPLHLAVLADSTQNVELLLANGASVHARDHASHSVLFHAANQGSAEIVKLLRDVGAHLSDIEIERGDVGFAITKGDEVVKQVWKKAAGTRYEAAVRALRQLGLQVAQQAA